MGPPCRSERHVVELVIIWLKFYSAISDQTICTDYLVSGVYGVEDAALTASSSYYSGRHEPPNARLYFEGDLLPTGRQSSWLADNNDVQQYIQVQFPRETFVDAVLIQGRMGHDQWVETYYLQYSMDGNTWTNVTSHNQEPRLFTGNSDRNTVERSSIDPSIRAWYLRINPRSWYNTISLRFDASGCYQLRKTRTRSSFYKLPTPPPTDLDPFLLFESQSTMFQACSRQCHEEGLCFSFSFDINQQNCRGFRTFVDDKTAAFSTEPTQYFVDKGTSFGFRPLPNEITLYKVNERNLDQANATNLCHQHQSRLIKIDSVFKMSNLLQVIAGNTILMHGHPHLFVSGLYVSGQWKYSDDDEVVNSALWSMGNPDSLGGHCVVLAQHGLASVSCSEQLYSICEKV